MSDTRFSFSKEKLTALPLPPAGSRSTFHDTRAIGLQLRVTSSGAKTFSVYRRIKGGNPERITLGKFPAMSVEQARKAAAEVNAKIESGANPAETKRSLRLSPTMSQFFNEYGKRHGDKKASWKDDQQRYRDHIEPLLGKKRIADIARSDLASLLSSASMKGLSPGTVRHLRALISNMFSNAVEWGFIEHSPAVKLKVSGAVNERDRFLNSDELPRFFKAVEEDENLIVKDLIKVALFTGARRENVSSMRWQDVDLGNAIWRILNTKNQTPQSVTLSPEAVAILARRQAEHKNLIETKNYVRGAPYVFPGIGNKGYINNPRSTLQRILDRDEIYQIQALIIESGNTFEWPLPRPKPKGNRGSTHECVKESLARARNTAKRLKIDISNCRISDLVFHDLRRTIGSWQAITGASLPIIGKSLNQKTPRATAIYARLQLDPVRESIDKATEKMLSFGLKPASE